MPVPILFLGNSYTEVNALDQVVQALLREGAAEYAEAEATRLSAGGLRFTDHVSRAVTEPRWEDALVTGDTAWRWALLQEQSQIPGFYGEDPVWAESAGAAATLDGWIAARGGDTWLLLTWGRRDGDSTNPSLYPDFPTMQAELTEGTLAYQTALSTPERPVWVAPAGLAFAALYDQALAAGQDPGAALFGSLYAEDGSHPSPAGTYLTACVVYAAITGQSPEGLQAPGGLDPEVVGVLQATAAEVVLEGELRYPWSQPGGSDSADPDSADPDSADPDSADPDSADPGEDPTKDDAVDGPRCGPPGSRVAGIWASVLAVFGLRKRYNTTVVL